MKCDCQIAVEVLRVNSVQGVLSSRSKEVAVCPVLLGMM